MAVNAGESGQLESQSRSPKWLILSSVAILVGSASTVFLTPEPTVPAVGPSHSGKIAAWRYVEDFRQPLAQFQTVFWEPRDTDSLRQLIRESRLVQDKSVLEIGTGTGLIALCCLQASAKRVLATDVNPAALANARWNAQSLGLSSRLETRLVPLDQPSAYTVIRSDEQFDLIISNPPWEDERPKKIDEFALYDPGFGLLDSIVRGSKQHLRNGGRIMLVYGSVEAIERLQSLADECEFKAIVHDDRQLDQLQKLFLPGMLIELRQPETK
jgi:release factor glutamine methyltransferase